MKTAEDILINEVDAETNGFNSVWEFEEVIKAMKLYASQFIDAAADTVELKDDWEDPYQKHDYPEHQSQTYGDGRDGDVLVWIDRDSILKLKDQLK